MTFARQHLGRQGESAAAAWYTDHGYEVVARNWRCRDGELDLVLARTADNGRGVRRELVFCEVKSRTTTAFGLPQEAVTVAKQRRVRRLAAAWMATHDTAGADIRFDVAAVLAGEVEVIPAAF